MEEETRLKEELRELHFMEIHLYMGINDVEKAKRLLKKYKKDIINMDKENIDELKEMKLRCKLLNEAIMNPSKAKLTLEVYRKEILAKRQELARIKLKERIGR